MCAGGKARSLIAKSTATWVSAIRLETIGGPKHVRFGTVKEDVIRWQELLFASHTRAPFVSQMPRSYNPHRSRSRSPPRCTPNCSQSRSDLPILRKALPAIPLFVVVVVIAFSLPVARVFWCSPFCRRLCRVLRGTSATQGSRPPFLVAGLIMVLSTLPPGMMSLL